MSNKSVLNQKLPVHHNCCMNRGRAHDACCYEEPSTFSVNVQRDAGDEIEHQRQATEERKEA